MTERLSVPLYRATPPRKLTEEERGVLVAIADALIPPARGLPAPSAAPDYARWLDRALAARRDAFDLILATAARLQSAGGLGGALRELADQDGRAFQALSTVVSGAYLMLPEVRREIGYPGQERKHPRFDEAAEEIMDGILDPVIERGAVYRAV